METHPLNSYAVQKWASFTNKTHTLIHSLLLASVIYYRISSLKHTYTHTPTLPFLLIFASEIILSYLWLLYSAHGWRPIQRAIFPRRLPPDEQLPPVDVFICTSDPGKEPPEDVMNTVISAMSLDYPADKLAVYISDDAVSRLTLKAARLAWDFAALWVPFCRTYGVECRCPKAFFERSDDVGCGSEFGQAVKEIEREYEQFKQRLKEEEEAAKIKDKSIKNERNKYNAPTIEIIGQINSGVTASDRAMPRLVYVSREKKPSHPHHFKAGALNVLLRVSAVISNSPYILVLDCDMYSNDPSSIRQAMCFHLDQKLSSSLAFVQFPQKFHNLSKNDIYDARLRSIFMLRWPGMDGLRGPMLSGTCFYIKREALYGTRPSRGLQHKDTDVVELQKTFGPSNELIKSLSRSGSQHFLNILPQETKLLASCSYEESTKWGKQIGFLYDTIMEDYFTGFNLHCHGWISIFYDAPRPAFLGSATTNLNDMLIQGMRWNSGVFDVFLSRFNPLIYGLPRMDILQCMCYTYLASQPLYWVPVACLAILPQLCLLNDIPTYPKASSPWFIVFALAFSSPLLKSLWDVLHTGGNFQTWANEWRIWMIKSTTAYFYGSLDSILKLVGMRKASFTPTNKVNNDDERVKRYKRGVFDFQTSIQFLLPLVTCVSLNIISFIWGTYELIFKGGKRDEMFAQVLLSFFILIMNYPMVEGMILRRDKGSIPYFVTLLSFLFSLILLSFGSIAL